MAGRIFINYRRDDSIASAGRLHDRLADAFGRKRLFMDVDHIPAGVDFVDHLDRQVAACDVFLALIGPSWVDAKDENGHRRLDNPEDFVSVEIAAALARPIRVIPVLIDGARLPRADELPEPLKPLLRRNAVELRNAQFRRDADALVEKVREALKGTDSSARRWPLWAAGAAALILAAGIGLYQAGWWPLAPGVVDTSAPDKAKAAAEVEARRKLEETALKAEEERKRAEASAQADAARRKAEEEARRKAEEEAKRKAEEEVKRKAEEERKRLETEARRDPASDVKPGSARAFRDRLVNGSPCPTCPEMVVVPAGDFMMGSPDGEAGRYDNEGPQRRVTFARPFAVGTFAVTRGEFTAFVKETDRKIESGCDVIVDGAFKPQADRSWQSPGFDQDDRHPVVCVNWDDVQAYTAWLSAKVGKTYRLLTEAEWEYAARAGTVVRFHFGDDEKEFCRYGNGADQAARKIFPSWNAALPCDDGYVFTAPSGSFRPNFFGLYDMLGNVRQRVEDCYYANYAGAPIDGSARITAGCKAHIDRGGTWASPPRNLRAAFRGWNPSGRRTNFLGFRVARVLVP